MLSSCGAGTLESLLDSKEIKPILKEINPEYSLEGLLLKLKIQYFDHLMWSTNWLEKTLMLGKIEGKRRRQRTRWLVSITNSIDMNLSKLRELVKDRRVWCTIVHGVAKSQTWVGSWTTATKIQNSTCVSGNTSPNFRILLGQHSDLYYRY